MQDKSLYNMNTVGLESALSTNKVLKNTYMLLGMTLLFSALTAGLSMAAGLGHGTALVLSLVGFGLLFVVHRTADTSKGLLAIFAFTGVMGASIGPMLNYYLAMPNGPSLVMQALGGTAVVFFGLSAYALTIRKDFSYMGGFLMIGLLVASVINAFVGSTTGMLVISALSVMIFSAFMLYDIRRIIDGGETNYISATLALYLDIVNVFQGLLAMLGIMGGDD